MYKDFISFITPHSILYHDIIKSFSQENVWVMYFYFVYCNLSIVINSNSIFLLNCFKKWNIMYWTQVFAQVTAFCMVCCEGCKRWSNSERHSQPHLVHHLLILLQCSNNKTNQWCWWWWWYLSLTTPSFKYCR